MTYAGQQIRIIRRDQDGCFLSTVVAYGVNATWTITNDMAADYGSRASALSVIWLSHKNS
jgi:hypothetical protein